MSLHGECFVCTYNLKWGAQRGTRGGALPSTSIVAWSEISDIWSRSTRGTEAWIHGLECSLSFMNLKQQNFKSSYWHNIAFRLNDICKFWFKYALECTTKPQDPRHWVSATPTPRPHASFIKSWIHLWPNCPKIYALNQSFPPLKSCAHCWCTRGFGKVSKS